MKPTSPRAARRQAAKFGKGALTLEELAQRVAKARVSGVDKARVERARRILTSYLQTAFAHQIPAKDVLAEMASGKAAWRLGMAVRDELMKSPPKVVQEAACAEGCAFCCILNGGEGGVITAFEAEQLHTALTPLAGQPDGRAWHPKGCPALDPDTRSCRAYDARPMICRSFISTDAAACEINAEGGKEMGAGLLGNHLDYLLVLALCRAALKGITQVQTYSLADTAALGVAGADGIADARQKTSALEIACHDALVAATA
ncbi:YkgJ family cysteine cluster protein [Yoonia litorea]|uniref:Putative zinc-or iron-chelating domain-containing protein n=1 Tax=Yoonia litorea TaxID=1123755 RepID=A0A1I6N1E6_9RHOB|nr:YkgJ family cysteine cluster protein [Yoonia litorea]SFS21792.1 Putative zinc-or iron-chelating domain-containing protein [Yoonia litorea]